MDQNGQLTFSDDPLQTGSNEVFQLIEEGSFLEAVKKLDELMDINPDFPGFVEAYRTARFWDNRRDEIRRLNDGKQTADFLMRQWEEFHNYSEENNVTEHAAFKAAMKYIFFTASKHYTIAFQEQESTADNFDLLLNLGICFITLEEYRSAIETLEYARISYKNSAKLLSLLGESNFHIDERSKSILYFREAFFIDPSDIDLDLLKAQPVLDIIDIIGEKKPDLKVLREWIPIFGFTEDIFNARRNLNSEQIETIRQEIYSLEKNFQTISKEKISDSNIVPRLINKYIWMLDFFYVQKYDSEIIKEIKDRLITIDKDLFGPFFEKADIR